MNTDHLFTVLELQGSQIEKFLHDYTIRSFTLKDPSFHATAFLNKKGRVVTTALVSLLSENKAKVVIPKDCLEPLQEHLKLYARFSRVTLTETDFDDNFDKKLLTREISIQQPLPWLDSNHVGVFTPACLSLDILGWIDFKKGCYLGQEIVSRMHYKVSHRKKALVRSENSQFPENIFPEFYREHTHGFKVLTVSQIEELQLVKNAFL